MRTRIGRWLGIVLLPAVVHAQAKPDTTIKVTFGGFVDGYYAYDVGRPPDFDRSFAGGALFTTQPARSNEFNVNLAYVEANLTGNRIHGRLALQAGTAVQSNYNNEPTNGIISGPLLSRFIQEAYAGYQVAHSLWIDAGIFYSNAGLESWASKDNPTYTRSLVADYSPYYSSGVRAFWQATPRLIARLDVVNGWQNISETNTEKGVGLRFDYTASTLLTASYYNFINTEVGSRVRLFNGAGAKVIAGPTTLLGELDVGSLGAGSVAASGSNWWGYTAVARQQVTPQLAIAGRVERYVDPGQVNIVTGLADPFRGNGASLGVDVNPEPRISWRTEARAFFADRAIFPNDHNPARKADGFIVSSLGLVF